MNMECLNYVKYNFIIHKLVKDYYTTFLTKDCHRLSGLGNKLCPWYYKSICYRSRPGTQETGLHLKFIFSIHDKWLHDHMECLKFYTIEQL